MAKSLTANVTSGRLAGNSMPVLLVQLTDGTNTFRWGTRGTADFSAWTGTAHVGSMLVPGSLPSFHHEIDLPGGKHVGNLPDMTLTVLNSAYSGTTRFDEYLVGAGITLQGMDCEVALVMDASDASWANRVTVYAQGKVTSFDFDLDHMRIQVQGRTASAFAPVPGAKAAASGAGGIIVGDDEFPDWNASDLGNQDANGKTIPMIFGAAVPSVPCYLTDSSAGAQVVTLESRTIYDGGVLHIEYDTDIWQVSDNHYAWGSAQRTAEFISEAFSTDVNRVAFWTDLLVATSWAAGTGLTNPGNAVDANPATYATFVLNDSLDKDDYHVFSGVGTDALKDRLLSAPLLGVYVYAKIVSASLDLDGGATYTDHIRLKGGPGAGWDTAVDGQFPYSGTSYDSFSGSDDPARVKIGNSAVDPPPSVESVLLAGIAFAPGNRSAPESITAYFYEFRFRLELAAPFYTSPFWAVGPSGRVYGSSSGFTGSGRYASAATTDLIESPAAVIENILRYEMGETTDIDTASFDAAFDALNDWAYTGVGSDIPQEWSICGATTEISNAKAVIEGVCKETALAFIDRYDGTFGLSLIAPAAPVKTISHSAGDIREGTFKPVKYGHSKDIWNAFVIRYDFDIRTGTYRKTLRINKDTGIAAGAAYCYLQNACEASVAAYGLEQEMLIKCAWIHTADAAYKLADWLVWRWTRPPKLIEFQSAGLDDVDLELVDTVTVDHPLTEAEDYIVYGLTFNSESLTTTIKAMYIPDLSRDNGDPE